MSESSDIAVIGGGAAGTLLAVQLALQARTSLAVSLHDTGGAFARGVAYGTRDPAHLLNVRTDRMGAFADRPDDFQRWLSAEFRQQEPDPAAFMPRRIYGDYLISLLAHARRKLRLETFAHEVTDASFDKNGVMLTLAGGLRHRAGKLVLAIGNLPIRKLQNEDALLRSGRYAGPIWDAPEGSILTRKSFTPQDSPVLIIGTGLTMIDALLSLRNRGYDGPVFAASRDGLMPQPHLRETPSCAPFLPPESAPRTAMALLRAVRHEIARNPDNWRGIIDSLRADTPQLWANLPEGERRKLLRVQSFWGTHRHRMPPESAARIEREIATGKLTLLRGRMRRLEVARTGIDVELATRAEPLKVAHVLNCSGPESDITRARSPLLQALLAKGAITPGPLAMGIATSTDYRAKGKAEDRLFIIGPQLLGERYETVAVPELRRQAEELAAILCHSPNSQ